MTGGVRQLDTSLSTRGLVDALDRLIGDGVSVTGDVVIGIAGVDLIRLDLRVLLAGVSTELKDGPS